MSGAGFAPPMGLRAVLGGLRPRAMPPRVAAAVRLIRRAPPGLLRLLPGLGALLVSSVLFLAMGPGGSARRVSGAALAVAAQLRAEDEAVRRELHPAASAARIAPAAAPQRFLREVLAAAAVSGLRVTRLAPLQHVEGAHGEGGLALEATGRFPELLRFVTEVELGRGALHGLRVRAAPGGRAAGRRRDAGPAP